MQVRGASGGSEAPGGGPGAGLSTAGSRRRPGSGGCRFRSAELACGGWHVAGGVRRRFWVGAAGLGHCGHLSQQAALRPRTAGRPPADDWPAMFGRRHVSLEHNTGRQRSGASWAQDIVWRRQSPGRGAGAGRQRPAPASSATGASREAPQGEALTTGGRFACAHWTKQGARAARLPFCVRTSAPLVRSPPIDSRPCCVFMLCPRGDKRK